MSTKYYCTKCKHNHFITSKIGENHLKHKTNNYESLIKQEIKKVQKSEKKVIVQVSANKSPKKVELENNAINKSINETNTKENESSNLIVRYMKDYQKSYRKGIENYGVWWKIFQLSIWAIVLILLLTASIIFIVFLPKIDLINWILR